MPRTRTGACAPISSVAQQLLFRGNSLDFQSTADQLLTKLFNGASYVITQVLAIRRSGAASVACLGGIYTDAAKGGTPLVASTQSWLGLSGVGKIVNATLPAVIGTDFQTATPILSLTTGSIAAITADILIYGCIVD